MLDKSKRNDQSMVSKISNSGFYPLAFSLGFKTRKMVVIDCKTLKTWLLRFDPFIPFIVPVSLLLVKLSVQSIVCLVWCR